MTSQVNYTPFPTPDVLLSVTKSQIKSPTPIHQLATISKNLLLYTPSQISNDFPTIKLSITDQNGQQFSTEAFLDSGATSTCISKAFVEDHCIPTCQLSYLVYAYNADDSLNSSAITHEAQIMASIQGHFSTEWYFVTDIRTKPLVIGMTWLQSHNPLIDWRTGALFFS